jgi:hypothetical protein
MAEETVNEGARQPPPEPFISFGRELAAAAQKEGAPGTLGVWVAPKLLASYYTVYISSILVCTWYSY